MVLSFVKLTHKRPLLLLLIIGASNKSFAFQISIWKKALNSGARSSPNRTAYLQNRRKHWYHFAPPCAKAACHDRKCRHITLSHRGIYSNSTFLDNLNDSLEGFLGSIGLTAKPQCNAMRSLISFRW